NDQLSHTCRAVSRTVLGGLVVALGIGKQERRATASLLAISGSRYRGERSEKPDRRERPSSSVVFR
ncbi:hypothetical protein KFE26_23765, partial [Shewanella sp. M16]|uniref:hypothetical protein n=1 Tax=Shewanella sp. M16 TaxID=2830837 RepID=UPI001BB025C8